MEKESKRKQQQIQTKSRATELHKENLKKKCFFQ